MVFKQNGKFYGIYHLQFFYILDERAELRESENRRGYDELRRNSDFERRNHQDDERRQRIERDERHIERLNRRQGLSFLSHFYAFRIVR